MSTLISPGVEGTHDFCTLARLIRAGWNEDTAEGEPEEEEVPERKLSPPPPPLPPSPPPMAPPKR